MHAYSGEWDAGVAEVADPLGPGRQIDWKLSLTDYRSERDCTPAARQGTDGPEFRKSGGTAHGGNLKGRRPMNGVPSEAGGEGWGPFLWDLFEWVPMRVGACVALAHSFGPPQCSSSWHGPVFRARCWNACPNTYPPGPQALSRPPEPATLPPSRVE